ncbi:MAG: hypothetical protein Q4D61_02290 [Cardiobacteriaceae bacterium]|nr:hypothetical protein [Cardiobacteriaceae bacterium]
MIRNSAGAARMRKGIHGYFYGDKAQYIGGTYFVPEGVGAFVTEKQ